MENVVGTRLHPPFAASAVAAAAEDTAAVPPPPASPGQTAPAAAPSAPIGRRNVSWHLRGFPTVLSNLTGYSKRRRYIVGAGGTLRGKLTGIEHSRGCSPDVPDARTPTKAARDEKISYTRETRTSAPQLPNCSVRGKGGACTWRVPADEAGRNPVGLSSASAPLA